MDNPWKTPCLSKSTHQSQGIRGMSAADPAGSEPFPQQDKFTDSDKKATPASDAWACPMCLQDLGCYRQEIGALTWEGRRQEPALYHLGCVSMLLLQAQKKRHASLLANGGELGEDGDHWLLSPLTRQRVDGFLAMPSPSDRNVWVKFFDWRGTGLFDAAELAYVVTNLFPAGGDAAKRLLQDAEQLKQQSGGSMAKATLSAHKLESDLMPVLAAHYGNVEFGSSVGSTAKPTAEDSADESAEPTFGEVVRQLSSWLGAEYNLADASSLLATCRGGREVARALLVHNATQGLMTARSARKSKLAKIEVQDVLKALTVLTQAGDSSAVRLAVQLLQDPKAEVREAAVHLLAVSAEQRPNLPTNLVAWYAITQDGPLKDSEGAVRVAAIRCLGSIAGFAAPDPEIPLRTIVPLLTSDRNRMARLAAQLAIRHILGRRRLGKDDMQQQNFELDGLMVAPDKSPTSSSSLPAISVPASVFSVLEEFLRDESTFLRRAAVNTYVIVWCRSPPSRHLQSELPRATRSVCSSC
eukprot:TRINITY_DN38217_c0_g1_i2.p1 TRINITY_DN38217_c0_g1~~TRINITY_DN38217_c0_g1_i2.p1  ORF type:complete len:526 (+),score=99.46 TRINITY_DN38217_c0_g1_i2:42-1619(+)